MATKNKKIGNVPNLRFPGFEGGWVNQSLGEICKMQAGKFVSASEIYEFQDSSLYPCYGGNGLRGYTKSYNQDGKFSLIGRQGALCGNVTLADGKFHATEHAVVVYPNDNLDTIWGYYLLNYLNLNKYATGMAQPGLSVQNLEKVATTIPNTKVEQRHIAKFLSLIDERISTQNKIIEYLETSIISFREKLLSQKLRFKDEYGNEFRDWEMKKLGEVALKKSSNISANKIEDNFGEFIIYGASGILKHVDFYEEEQDYVSIIKDGAGVGRLLYCTGKSSVLGTMEIIRPKETLNTYFLYCLLSNIDFAKYISGSTIPHIYFKDYANELCDIPCFHEQIKISNFLSAIDKKIEAEKKILIQYDSLKKYFLQNLFI